MSLSERLATLRKKKGLKQEDVAKIIGKSLPGYASYEQARNEPSLEVLRKLSFV